MSNLSRRSLFLLTAGAALAGFGCPVRAAALASPSGKPILRVAGAIAHFNEDDEAVFDVAMLDALGRRSFSTGTPWTEGVAEWEGVPLVALMEAVGATGATIRATALNDYVVDLPTANLAEDGAILALRRNGELMPVSDKGPLFILYPFDDVKRLQQQAFYMRCAWQVARLDIR